MKHSGLQRARQSTRKKMKKSLGPDFVDPSNLGLHGKETSLDVRCDICHEGLPINSKKDCITCKKCAIRAHATCVRTQLNVKYIKTLWLCVNCRHCYECDKSGVDQNELIFCRSCELSYHYDCVKTTELNAGNKWICHRCKKPQLPITRVGTASRQNSSTAATTTTTSTTNNSTTTTTTTPTATPNANNRVAARTVYKSQIEGKSPNVISSHPSTSSSSSTPTPSTSTSRTPYHVKREMIIDKQKPRSHSNNPSERQARPDHPERPPLQARPDRLIRSERPMNIDPMSQRRQERPMNVDSSQHKRPARPVSRDAMTHERPTNINPNPRPHERSERPERPANINTMEARRVNHASYAMFIGAQPHRRQERSTRYKHHTVIHERPMRTNLLNKSVNDSRNNIDLPDVDMKDSFTDKPLTNEHNEKIPEKPRLIKKVEPERENINDKSKDSKEKIEKQTINENRLLSTEPSTENNRNPINVVNITNGTGIKTTSSLSMNLLNDEENKHIEPTRPMPPKVNLPEKRKVSEIQGSGFVLSKPAELTEETAKLLKDSNGAKRLKLVLFERACKAESLLPAETSVWTTEDVSNFIRFIGFPDAADNFADHQIDGKSLLLLSRRDVLTGFKLKLGPALKIYAHIFRLQRKRPALLLED